MISTTATERDWREALYDALCEYYPRGQWIVSEVYAAAIVRYEAQANGHTYRMRMLVRENDWMDAQARVLASAQERADRFTRGIERPC